MLVVCSTIRSLASLKCQMDDVDGMHDETEKKAFFVLLCPIVI